MRVIVYENRERVDHKNSVGVVLHSVVGAKDQPESRWDNTINNARASRVLSYKTLQRNADCTRRDVFFVHTGRVLQ